MATFLQDRKIALEKLEGEIVPIHTTNFVIILPQNSTTGMWSLETRAKNWSSRNKMKLPSKSSCRGPLLCIIEIISLMLTPSLSYLSLYLAGICFGVICISCCIVLYVPYLQDPLWCIWANGEALTRTKHDPIFCWVVTIYNAI